MNKLDYIELFVKLRDACYGKEGIDCSTCMLDKLCSETSWAVSAPCDWTDEDIEEMAEMFRISREG